jgi:predicted transcriptional regulator
MDKLKIKEIALSVINAHALPVVSLYATKDNPTLTDAFIRDTDKKFERIANEIAKKICDVDERKS